MLSMSELNNLHYIALEKGNTRALDYIQYLAKVSFASIKNIEFKHDELNVPELERCNFYDRKGVYVRDRKNERKFYSRLALNGYKYGIYLSQMQNSTGERKWVKLIKPTYTVNLDSPITEKNCWQETDQYWSTLLDAFYLANGERISKHTSVTNLEGNTIMSKCGAIGIIEGKYISKVYLQVQEKWYVPL